MSAKEPRMLLLRRWRFRVPNDLDEGGEAYSLHEPGSLSAPLANYAEPGVTVLAISDDGIRPRGTKIVVSGAAHIKRMADAPLNSLLCEGGSAYHDQLVVLFRSLWSPMAQLHICVWLDNEDEPYEITLHEEGHGAIPLSDARCEIKRPGVPPRYVVSHVLPLVVEKLTTDQLRALSQLRFGVPYDRAPIWAREWKELLGLYASAKQPSMRAAAAPFPGEDTVVYVQRWVDTYGSVGFTATPGAPVKDVAMWSHNATADSFVLETKLPAKVVADIHRTRWATVGVHFGGSVFDWLQDEWTRARKAAVATPAPTPALPVYYIVHRWPAGPNGAEGFSLEVPGMASVRDQHKFGADREISVLRLTADEAQTTNSRIRAKDVGRDAIKRLHQAATCHTYRIDEGSAFSRDVALRLKQLWSPPPILYLCTEQDKAGVPQNFVLTGFPRDYYAALPAHHQYQLDYCKLSAEQLHALSDLDVGRIYRPHDDADKAAMAVLYGVYATLTGTIPVKLPVQLEAGQGFTAALTAVNTDPAPIVGAQTKGGGVMKVYIKRWVDSNDGVWYSASTSKRKRPSNHSTDDILHEFVAEAEIDTNEIDLDVQIHAGDEAGEALDTLWQQAAVDADADVEAAVGEPRTTDAPRPQPRTKAALKRQGKAVVGAMALGAGVAVLDQSGEAMLDAFEKLLLSKRPNSLVHEMFRDPLGRELLKVLAALSVHTLAHQTELLPKPELLGRIAELQIAFSVSKLVGPNIEVLRKLAVDLIPIAEKLPEGFELPGVLTSGTPERAPVRNGKASRVED